MIAEPLQKMLLANREHFLIPADLVANVQTDNNLYHAFLVLSKIRYAKVPVLDNDGLFKGLLSLPMITNVMLGDQIDAQILLKKTVADVMETDVTTISDPYDVEEILHQLIDVNFIPVVASNNEFTGIVTRREFMKSFNYLVHEFGKQYDMIEKDSSTVSK